MASHPKKDLEKHKQIKISDISKVTTTKQFTQTWAGAGNKILWTPATGKKCRLKFLWGELSADVDLGYRFGATGDIYYLRVTKGVFGMNFIGCNDQGDTDEVVYLYASGACSVKGFVKGEDVD